MTWTFPKLADNQMGGNSLVTEFFGGERNVRVDCLVREAIQNALDAKAKDEEYVGVLFKTGELDDSGSQWVRDTVFTDQFREHVLAAEKADNDANAAARRARIFEGPISYLLIEDTGTTGLGGPVDHTVRNPEHATNALTCFLRLNGESGKREGESLGSFGVGRHVFYSASQLQTFLVHTMPLDSQRIDSLTPGSAPTMRTIEPSPMLFGMSLQRSRQEYDSTGHTLRYDNYLAFGMPSASGNADSIHIPYGVEDVNMDVAMQAHEMLQCKRPQAEPGTSIMVLQPHRELNEKGILKAVIKEFALPVLTGALQIRVNSISITADTIEQHARDHIDARQGDFVRFLKKAIETRDVPSIDIDLGNISAATSIDLPSLVAEDVLTDTAVAFRGGKLITVHGSLQFFDMKASAPDGEVRGSFCVQLAKVMTGERGKWTIARSGLTISGPGFTDQQFRRDFNALTTIESKDSLGHLLHRAEGPAHDEWKPSRIEEDCTHAREIIQIVRTAARVVGGALLRHGAEHDRTIFADLLPAPSDEYTGTSTGGGGDDDDKDPNDKPIPDTWEPKSIFELDMLGRGEWFRVRLGKNSKAKPGAVVEIKLAYDVATGNPASAWSPSDFDLRTIGISSLLLRGVDDAKIMDGRTFRGIVADPEAFAVQFPSTSFDPKLDLRIQAEIAGGRS